MSENVTQAINTANLSERDLRFIKAQQAIDNLRRDIEQNEELKSQLETAENLAVFFSNCCREWRKFYTQKPANDRGLVTREYRRQLR